MMRRALLALAVLLLLPASVGQAKWPDGGGGSSGGSGQGFPAGSGSELQHRVDGTTFGAVSGTSVSGSTVVSTGTIDLGNGTLVLPNGNAAPGLTSTGQVFWDEDGCLKILDNGGGGQRTRTICAPKIFYPEDYVDDTPASAGIQGAIDAAASEMEGGLVLLSFNNEVASTGHYPITAEADSANYPGCALVVKPGVVLMGSAGGFGSNDGTVITLKNTTLTNGVCIEGDSAAAVGFRIQVDGSISDASAMTGLTVSSANYVSEWFIDDVAIRGAAGTSGSTGDLANCMKIRGLKGSMQRLKLQECGVGMLFENFNASSRPNAVSVYDSIFSSTWSANVRISGDPSGVRLVNNTFEFDNDTTTLTDGVDATGLASDDSLIMIGNWIEGKAVSGSPDVANGLLVKDGEIILMGNIFRGASSMQCSVKGDTSGTAIVAGFGNVFESSLDICDSGSIKWAMSGGNLPSTVPANFNVSPATVLAADCTTATAKRGSICIDSDDVAPAKVYWCSVASCSASADWIQLGDGGGSGGGSGDMLKSVYDTDDNGKVDTSDKHPSTSTVDALAVYSDTTGGLKDSLCTYSELGTTTKGGSIDCQPNDAGPSEIVIYEDSDNIGTSPVDELKLIGPSAIPDGGVSCTLEADSTPMDSCITVGTTIESSEITDETITSADIGVGQVGASEIASTSVTAGSYGDANNYPTFTVDADGRLTAAGTQALPTRSAVKCATVESPVDADDLLFLRADAALTVTDIDCLSVGTTPSITVVVNECDGNGGSCVAVETAVTCGSTNGSDDGTIDNAAIDAGDWLRLAFGAPSGTVDQTSVCVRYTW